MIGYLYSESPVRGMHTFKGDSFVKIVLLPSEKGLTLTGKNLLYLLRRGLLWEEIFCSPWVLCVQERKQVPQQLSLWEQILSFVFWKEVYSKRKAFAPFRSKFFPFRIDPFSEGSFVCRRETGVAEVVPLAANSFLLPCEKRSTLKRKNLLPMEANSILLE